MEELLRYLLNHYFADFKRRTETVITREVDSVIRDFVNQYPDLKVIIADCRKAANVLKKQRSRQTQRISFGNFRVARDGETLTPVKRIPDVEHVPCGNKGR